MATITGFTAERMLEIEGESIVDGEVIAGNLILTKHNGTPVDAGSVIGPQGIQGPTGPAASPDGWIAIPEALTFGAADAPSYTVTLPGDLTGTYFPGQKWKMTHAGVVKYFIVTAVSHAAGTTTVTLYGGTDYTLAAGAITLPYYSWGKAPGGFPLNPAKWTVELIDTVDRLIAASAGVWHNINSTQLSIPIGAWEVSYMVALQISHGAGMDNQRITASLSTANNTATDHHFYAHAQTNNVSVLTAHFRRSKLLLLAAKTTYYLIAYTVLASSSNLSYKGGESPTIIRAVCAYL